MPEFSVSFELVDDYNRTGRKTFQTVAALADFAAAAAAAAALAVDLAVLTEMRILAYSVSQRIPFTDAVTSGANKDEGVNLTLRKEDNFKDNIRIPAPINAIFDGLGNVLTPTPAAVQDFIDNFFTPAGEFAFSDGEQATEFVGGVLEQ